VSFTVVVADRSIDLAAERIDLAVRITNSLEPTMIARPLATCRSMLCASPDYAHAWPSCHAGATRSRCG
jgi:DNA-binding transcriptional LysR family regulator